MEGVAEKYPQLDGVEVYFVTDKFIKDEAATQFWKDGIKAPHIYIKAHFTLASIPEVMAHEMAHVIVGKPESDEDWHNNAWVDAFAKLLKEMNAWQGVNDYV